VLNPFMHSKMQFKQQKMVISPRFVSSNSGEKVQKVECLDNTKQYVYLLTTSTLIILLMKNSEWMN
jgi:hypothetical protein